MELFLLGFISATVWFFLGIIIIKELILRTNITGNIQGRFSEIISKTSGTNIIYPKIEEEIFKQEDSNIDDLLEN